MPNQPGSDPPQMSELHPFAGEVAKSVQCGHQSRKQSAKKQRTEFLNPSNPARKFKNKISVLF